jgi:hypothetical protein
MGRATQTESIVWVERPKLSAQWPRSLGRATQTESIVWVVDPNYLNKFDARNFVRFVVGHIDPVR